MKKSACCSPHNGCAWGRPARSLRKKKILKLKTGTQIGKAFGPEEERLMRMPRAAPLAAHLSGSHVGPKCGMRDANEDIDLTGIQFRKALPRSQPEQDRASEASRSAEFRSARRALSAYSKWYAERFGETQPEWYVFPFGKPPPNRPTRPVTTLKTAWQNLREKAKVTGRWHDNRHTLVTELHRERCGRSRTFDPWTSPVTSRSRC